MIERLFADQEPIPLAGEEKEALKEAFRARALASGWCGYAVPKHTHDDALAFLFTEGGNGGPFTLIRTQAQGYALATEDGLVVWTGKTITEVPGAFSQGR